MADQNSPAPQSLSFRQILNKYDDGVNPIVEVCGVVTVPPQTDIESAEPVKPILALGVRFQRDLTNTEHAIRVLVAISNALAKSAVDMAIASGMSREQFMQFAATDMPISTQTVVKD